MWRVETKSWTRGETGIVLGRVWEMRKWTQRGNYSESLCRQMTGQSTRHPQVRRFRTCLKTGNSILLAVSHCSENLDVRNMFVVDRIIGVEKLVVTGK